jgi:hypothetical protein
MSTKPSIYPDGNFYVFNEINSIQWGVDGNISIDGVIVDAMLLPIVKGDELPLHFQAKLQAYSEKGGFYYPDSDALTLLSIKLLFALAHEAVSLACLTDAERNIIETHIPWSARLCGDSVTFRGESYATEDFVRLFQSQLVLKKSQSMQGKDVMVGNAVSTVEWMTLFNQKRFDLDWLIQYYCAPDLIYSADHHVGMSEYRMIWGIFGFNNSYAGSWCRGVSQGNTDKVINLARGAVEFVVTEEQEKKEKLVL